MIDSCYKNIRKLCSGVFSWKQMLQFDRTPSTDLRLRPFIFFRFLTKFRTAFQGPVARCVIVINHWLRGIETTIG